MGFLGGNNDFDGQEDSTSWLPCWVKVVLTEGALLCAIRALGRPGKIVAAVPGRRGEFNCEKSALALIGRGMGQGNR